MATVLFFTIGAVTVLVLLGRWAAAQPPLVKIGCSLGGGCFSILLIGSMCEWLVHRYAMHSGHRFPLVRLATDLHQRAHHWVHFPPDRYIHAGPIEYPSVLGHGTAELCRTRIARSLTVASHAVFYSVFAIPILALVWVTTMNGWFTAATACTEFVLIFLFIRVHDAVHYPGASRLERFRWFWFLDRHHYIHHIDNRANTNFLLPLGDLLMGTLRRGLSPAELKRWPSYQSARTLVFDPVSGINLKLGHGDDCCDVREAIESVCGRRDVADSK